MATKANEVAMLATCFPGAHNEHVRQTVDGLTVLPAGWRFVSARLTDDGWAVDVTSETKVLCCPDHHPQR